MPLDLGGGRRQSARRHVMRTQYHPQGYACMDEYGRLLVVMPDECREEKFCPDCLADSCPFGKKEPTRIQPEPPVAGEDGWITMEEAIELTGCCKKTMYDAIYRHRIMAEQTINIGEKYKPHNYVVQEFEVIEMWGMREDDECLES